jgi:hypothetical protein
VEYGDLGVHNAHSGIVIKQCALERDLSLWEAGDRTEVGEKGLTLRCVIRTPSVL